jgi:B12-binding domain/radical SAM domain protein
MPAYDVVLIHPPAVYDFRQKPIFPGALGRTMASVQFNKVPVGMLSIAEYLDRRGYNVVVDNLCDRMLTVPGFDVEQHLRETSAKIYGVGLSFQQHAPGALAIARLVKELHPEALVVMGGLTATRFHEEIIAKYEFVDAVVRAEAEKPMLELVRAYEAHGRLTPTPNLTYRAPAGGVAVTPLMEASQDLDDFDFTRLDLLQPQTSIHIPDAPSRWSLVACRGCAYDCTICGGSAYTYEKYLGMPRPAFRSPAKIVADIKKLVAQNVRFIGLYQDIRAGGRSYWQELLSLLAKEPLGYERLSLDLLAPAGEDFISEVAKLGRNVILHFCPDTGCDPVRAKLGRHYTNDDIRATVRRCLKYRIPVTNFFSVGLAGETEQEMRETWQLWQELDALNRQAITGIDKEYLDKAIPSGGQVLGPIVIDPGSRAWDDPEACGYRLLYRDLEEYVAGLSQPTWDQWLDYETDLKGRSEILQMIYETNEFVIDQREREHLYGGSQAYYERCMLHADRVVLDEMAKARALNDPEALEQRAVTLRETLDALEKKRTFFQMTFVKE